MTLNKSLFLMIIFIIGLLLNTTVYSQDDVPIDSPSVTIHIVQRGESLFGISLQYDVSMDNIITINGITDPSNIQVGQRLLIPLDPIVLVPDPLSHIVRAGETLGRIAEFYDVTVDDLITLNDIENPNSLFVGQELIIREYTVLYDFTDDASDESQTQGEPISVPSVDIVHVVQFGETLFTISRSYSLTVADLQRANNLSDTAVIYAGQELVIPDIVPPDITLDLPPTVSSLDVTPLLVQEGRTSRIRLVTSQLASVTMRFIGQNIPVITEADGITHIAFIAVPVWTDIDIYTLTMTVSSTIGDDLVTVNLQIISGGYDSQYIILPDDRIELLNPSIEANEMRILSNVASVITAERFFDGSMSLPAAAAMNSPFGTSRSYNEGPFDRYHTGVDFAGNPGTPIYAASSGRVVLVDRLNIRGLSVMIDHGWGVYTNYSHMSETYVNLGQMVDAGQTIGTVGSSGRATGAHLHWELWVNGIPVDPMQWVQESFP